jgi:endonuclease YncB( thermonuclease family)
LYGFLLQKIKIVRKPVLFLLAVFLVILSAHFITRDLNRRCYIKRVIDGDTIELRDGKRVRLIGIDTPETVHPDLPVQRFGLEASGYMKKIAEGQYCRLEYEGKSTDYYGRLLAYVYTGSVMLNKEMLDKGYAFVYTKYPFVRMKEFLLVEQKARHMQRGLWNYTLSDGRLTGIVKMYGELSLEGRKKFDRSLRNIHKKYSQNGEH